MERAASLMTNDLKRDAPVDTGELRRKTGVSVTSESANQIRAEAVIDVEYAEVVIHGSRPHVIRPRTKKALAFQMGGKTIVVRKVNHPGTKANEFFQQIVQRWGDYLGRV